MAYNNTPGAPVNAGQGTSAAVNENINIELDIEITTNSKTLFIND